MSRASLAEIYISALPATAVAGRTPAELWTEAEQQVTAAVAKIEAMRQAGDLKAANRKYKIYRRTIMERGQRALPYSTFLEQRTATIVKHLAAGRMI